MGAPVRQRVVGSTTAAAVTVVLLWLVPRAAGTTWARVGNTFDQISAGNLAILAVLWITGLWCHSFVLGAALPGLTRRRALTLNLTGSAVANVLPLGGAAGIGLNFAMVRRWGFGAPSFAAFTTVTNVLDVGSKISVTAVACAVLMSRGDALTGPLGAAGPILIGALGAGAVLATLVFSPAGASSCGCDTGRGSRPRCPTWAERRCRSSGRIGCHCASGRSPTPYARARSCGGASTPSGSTWRRQSSSPGSPSTASSPCCR